MGFFSSSTFKRAGLAVATGGLSEFTHGADAFGVQTGLQAIGLGGKGYTPQQLPQTDPKMVLAQSGGAPLLTQIALGASVDDALAGYFGRSKGSDWDAYYKGLSPNEQAAIDGVKNQLTQIQSNTTLRNQAVQKVVNDFPNLVAQTAPAVAQAKQQAGEEFDSATKAAMDYALSSTASKYNASGMLSSGAAASAEARTGAQFGMERLNYTTGQGNQAFERGSQDLLGNWQAQYNEANALRGFQQTMLGQGVQQGFSAQQAALNRQQQTGEFNANANNQSSMQTQNNQNAMLGMVGQLGGTALGYGLAGPIGGMAGGRIGMSGYGTGGNSPRLSLDNNASAGRGA